MHLFFDAVHHTTKPLHGGKINALCYGKEHNLVRRLRFGYKIEANVSPYSHSMVEGGFDEMS